MHVGDTITHVILFLILGFMYIQQIEGEGTASYYPLTIICNSTKQKCWLSDTKFMRNELPSSNESKTLVVVRGCPTEDSQQPDNALYILTALESFSTTKYVHTEKICKQPFKPSVIHLPSTYSYEIGYALSTTATVQRILSDNIPDEYKKTSYYWFFEIRSMYDTEKLMAKGTNHSIFAFRHSKGEPCSDYSVGIEKLQLPHTDYDYIKNFYNPENQSKVLRNEFDNFLNSIWSKLLRRASSKGRQDTVVIYQLMPIDDFIEDSLKISTCSYLNTVPLWKTIAEGSAQMVENYIRKVADVLGKSPLNIWTEVYYEPTQQPIYLDHYSKKLPIPSHIIKLISYNAPKLTTEGEILITKYFIAIVIHNEIHRTGSKICEEIACNEYGWNVASIEGGLTYCCQANDLISITKIEASLAPRPVLDLYHVPALSSDRKLMEINAVQFLNGEFPPLTIVYDSATKTYKLSDLKAIRKSKVTGNQSQFSHILLCCPAETLEQEIMTSMSKLDALLFVKGVFQSVDEIPTNSICHFPYQPLVMYVNRSEKYYGNQGYQTGYMIKKNKKIMQKYGLPDMEEFEDHPEFYWIYDLWISYNLDQLYPSVSMHTITPYMHSQSLPATCADIAFGIEWFDGVDPSTWEKIFNEENQKNILDEFSTKTDQLFELHPLVPIDDYSSDSLRHATCNYFNAIPLWRSISQNPVRKVEEYIRKLADQFDFQSGTLEITTVPYQALKLPLKRKSNKPTEVFLHTTNNGTKQILVPKILMKIIANKVTLPSNEIQDQRYKIFAIVIVIHNELSYHVERICKSVCRQFGWKIEFEIYTPDNVYCCKLDEVNELPGFQRPYGDTLIEPFNLIDDYDNKL